jgi:hydrophobic/amphiphilic exporter-1 (mainly G- bacteria), HAE1 family
MDIIKTCIEKKVSVFVGIILVVLFGWIGLQRMPYQLSPTVIEPEISVSTTWPGATPYEVERDVIEEQEKVLKGIPNLIEMESSSFNSQGTVTLKFAIGTDVNDALLRVSNKLDEVPSYPENVEKPIITATGAAASPVVWMVLKADPDNPQSIYTYLTFFENNIRQYLERVRGVADLFIGGGTEKELHIVVSPERLAAHGLTIPQLIDILRAENVNISAGTMGVGRRDYRIRATAEFASIADVRNLIITSTGERRIRLEEIAAVRFGYDKLTATTLHLGREGIAIGVKPEPDANILDLTDRLETVVNWLNAEKLKPEKIFLHWVYDQRPYIRGAIDLVSENILLGALLAIAVLFLFLRSLASTLVVAAAIPISIIGTFVFMHLFGRTLNVVSLAGIAFAAGMLVDNAIVVLENIDRHRNMGKSSFRAAYDGAQEVWGAVLASTLTTVAVFLPVVFMQEEAGQLFRDIAIAITASITLSLVVSVLVIPMLSRLLYRLIREDALSRGLKKSLGSIGADLMNGFMFLLGLATRNWATRLATAAGFTAVAVVGSILLFPKMEYLPQGNRNLVINLLIPPPGLSYVERKAIGEQIFDATREYVGKDHDGYPGIKNMFFVGSEQLMLFGAISLHEQRAAELIPLFRRAIGSIPGMLGVSLQAGVFQTSLGRGRTIEVDLSGEDLNRLVAAAGMMFGIIQQEVPGSQVRPVPSLELLFPEVRLIPNRERLRAVGMSARDLGLSVDVLMDGRDIGEFKQEGEKKIDLKLKASEEDITTPELLYESLTAVPGGRVVLVSSLADLERTTGITQIRHLERKRTISLQVTPPFSVPLEQAMEIIEARVVPALKAQGALKGVDVGQSGVADKLTEARKTLQWDFVLAAVICYLLMAALFENFFYPLIILFTVPLASVGGLLGLKLVNLFIAEQPLDILTMLGFVILVGVVVNNAILIVHQSLNNIRIYGMEQREAVRESTRTRLRPIFMTALTSVFGMLPLVLVPGPGSEFYRGLGSVVLGGLMISTLFTIFVIPSLLLFFIGRETLRPSAELMAGEEPFPE